MTTPNQPKRDFYYQPIPTNLPTPPEHFHLTNVRVEGCANVERAYDIANPNALKDATYFWLGILDDIHIFADASDGQTELYAAWESNAYPQRWGEWFDKFDEEPFDAPTANYRRAVDKRAKEIYSQHQGDIEFGDCVEQAETEIAMEQHDAALESAS